jgi:dTDP-L-rhamnose 4-epimerase
VTKILITGGAGFIGSNLVAAVHANGHEITVLDNLSEQIHGSDPSTSPLFQAVRDKVRFIHGSVCDRDTLHSALDGQEVVVHLAAETGTGQSMYMVDHYTRVNIQATSTILDILGSQKNLGVKRVVIASSRSIYGEGKYLTADGRPLYPGHRKEVDMKAGRFEIYDPRNNEPLKSIATDEESLIHPSSVYGITKQVQEQLVMTVCPLLGIEPVALRYQNVYGPGQSLSNPYTGILSIFSNLIMQRGTINIFEDGLESRDFVFIDDVVDATIRAMEHENAAGHVFNVGSGVQTTVLMVVEQLFGAFGVETEFKVTGNFRLGDIRHNVADLTKIARVLGYHPRVDFAEGIRRFAAWAATQGPKSSAYERSLAEMRERGLMHGEGAANVNQPAAQEALRP